MMRRNILLPAVIFALSPGCYDSLTEADLCNPNFEDCSQYESSANNSGGSQEAGDSQEAGGSSYSSPVPIGGLEDDHWTCSDGYDNDQDGYVDCDDFGCSDTSACSDRVQSSEPGNTPGPENSPSDECLYSNVNESCVVDHCLSSLNECAATGGCTEGLLCLLNCEEENLNQCMWSAPIILQGLAACMQTYCL